MNSLACDVLVVGGGVAGIAAAAAAGRAGARVVLLEHYGFLGGLATAGMVGTVCGLYLRDGSAAAPALVAGGFVCEFATRLRHAADTQPQQLANGLWVLPYAPWDFERLADTIIGETPGVTPVLHATLAEVEVEDARVTGVHALAWNQRLQVRPAWIVDCTGEATVAALAGGVTQDDGDNQAPALVFVMENVAPGLTSRGWLNVLREVRRAVTHGRLPAGCEQLAPVPGPGPGGRLALKLNLTPAAAGLPTWAQLTTWERQGRAHADALQRFLITTIPAFRQARFAGAAAQLGVRSGRRVCGQVTLSNHDLRESRKGADGIARGSWPGERWRGGSRPEMIFFAERTYYEIPLGCLQVAGLHNVLAAGRCLAAEPEALASARVIGTALATGWAAGVAAATAAAGQPITAALPLLRAEMDG